MGRGLQVHRSLYRNCLKEEHQDVPNLGRSPVDKTTDLPMELSRSSHQAMTWHPMEDNTS
jgi:hypothetical protein